MASFLSSIARRLSGALYNFPVSLDPVIRDLSRYLFNFTKKTQVLSGGGTSKKDRDIPYRIIYGSVMAPGLYVWAKRNIRARYMRELYCVMVCCMHPVHYINSGYVFVNGKRLRFNSRGFCVSQGFRFHSYRTYFLSLNVLSNGNLPLPRHNVMSLCPSWRESNLNINDYATAFVRYIYSNHFRGRADFPEVLFEVKGKTVENPGTKMSSWSNNSSFCLYDFLTNVLCMEKKYIDTDSFLRAAEIGNTSVHGTTLFTCNGIIDVGDNVNDIINDMLFTMSGLLFISEGKIALRVAVGSDLDSNPIEAEKLVSISEKDLLDNVQVHHISDQPYNACIATIFCNDNGRVIKKILPLYKEENLVRNSNNSLCTTKIVLPFTNNEQIAKYLMKAYLFQSHAKFHVKITLSPKHGLSLRVHDVLKLSVSSLGWVDRRLRVTHWSYRNFKVYLILCEDIIEYKYLK